MGDKRNVCRVINFDYSIIAALFLDSCEYLTQHFSVRHVDNRLLELIAECRRQRHDYFTRISAALRVAKRCPLNLADCTLCYYGLSRCSSCRSCNFSHNFFYYFTEKVFVKLHCSIPPLELNILRTYCPRNILNLFPALR